MTHWRHSQHIQIWESTKKHNTHPKNIFYIRFHLACSLHSTSNKSRRWINFPWLKTNSLIEKMKHPHPRNPFINPTTSSGFHKANFGGSSVTQFSLNSNLQSLQKAIYHMHCLYPGGHAETHRGYQYVFADQTRHDIWSASPSQGHDKWNHKKSRCLLSQRLSMGCIIAHRRFMIKTTHFLIIDLQD